MMIIPKTGSNIHRSQVSKQMPTSVSGYSICATQGDQIDELSNAEDGNKLRQDQINAFANATRQHQLQQSLIFRSNDHPSTRKEKPSLAMSASNYSMASGMHLCI